MKISIPVLLLILFSCANNQEKKVAVSINDEQPTESIKFKSEFVQLCLTLPKMDLPFSVYCTECCAYPTLSEEQQMVKRYLPEGASFIGVIDINEAYISVLASYPADMIIPTVVVFDLKGEIIDEEFFLGGYCDTDYGYLGKQYFYIHNKTEIVEIDTVYLVSYDEETFHISDTTKTEIERKKFRISPKGLIKRMIE